MDFDEAKRASRAVSAQGGEGMPTYACVRHGTSAHEGCGYCEQAQEFRTARLARLRDAVVEEAVAHRRGMGLLAAHTTRCPLCIAVSAYLAAKETP